MTDITRSASDITTEAIRNSDFSSTIGYVAILIAALFFGSNFLVVKKYPTGNGIFFQWILCVGIWTTGLITTAARGFPKFIPLAMLGGFVWCTGNLMCVPAINLIGMAKGILLWGCFNLIVGWASSRFGWFGLNSQPPRIPWLNYFGVALCLVSACMYLLTKTTGNDTQEDSDDPADEESIFTNSLTKNNNNNNNNNKIKLNKIESNTGENNNNTNKNINTNINNNINKNINNNINNNNDDKISPKKEDDFDAGRLVALKRFKKKLAENKIFVRILGSFMACASGVFFGLTFAPVIYIKDRYPQASENSLDHVFAHFTGIFISSTFYFLIYCIFSRNTPTVYPKVVLPGYISGLMWGIACICWFIANDALSEAVSYPMATTLPGIIATLWGLLFREVKGLRNYIVLFFAISIGLAGSIATGLSK